MNVAEWEASVPKQIREDSLWRMESYRLGLFLAELAMRDARNLLADRRTIAIADQLVRAAGNISSNWSEGYSRGTGKDRARFYEYALGSAREARDWYYKSHEVLKPEVIVHRIDLSTQIVRLTLKMVSNERRRNFRFNDPRAQP